MFYVTDNCSKKFDDYYRDKEMVQRHVSVCRRLSNTFSMFVRAESANVP